MISKAASEERAYALGTYHYVPHNLRVRLLLLLLLHTTILMYVAVDGGFWDHVSIVEDHAQAVRCSRSISAAAAQLLALLAAFILPAVSYE